MVWPVWLLVFQDSISADVDDELMAGGRVHVCVHIPSVGGMVLATACGHQCCTWAAGSGTVQAVKI